RRLRPGVSVFGVPGRGTALRDPAGRLRGVDLPEDTVAALTRWLDGTDPQAPPGLDDEIGAFAAAGYLHVPQPPRTVTVTVAGTGVAADAVAAALAGPSTRVRRAGVAELRAALDAGTPLPDAVCAVADGPAPAAWTGLDGLPGHGTAWLRLAVEGRHAILEPVAAAPGDPGHADVRARRLAAAGSGHPHLHAYWDAAAATAPGAADMALPAALLAADVRAWATGHLGAPAAGDLVPVALPARRRLRVVDLDTAAIADHPLLPVPSSAP
ncbi:hypothetical protein, partial [Pseudonocardia spirodelae]